MPRQPDATLFDELPKGSKPVPKASSGCLYAFQRLGLLSTDPRADHTCSCARHKPVPIGRLDHRRHLHRIE
eukprot:5034657-Amphidinium_carterae.1